MIFSDRKTRGGAPEAMFRLIIAATLFVFVALFGANKEYFGVAPGSEGPRMVQTIGQRQAACARQTVQTAAGTLGCGSIQSTRKMGNVSFLSAKTKR